MKLLFDENLPASMVRRLADVFPGSAHVVSLGLGSVDDLALWVFAKESGFTLVTKDSDFHDICAVRGAPPKVVWLRIGNCSVNEIEQVLRSAVLDLRALDEDSEASELMVIGRADRGAGD